MAHVARLNVNEVLVLSLTHKLYLSDRFPNLSFLIKSPQRFLEGGSLLLHLDVYIAPLRRIFLLAYKLFQDLDHLGVLGGKIFLFLAFILDCSVEQRIESLDKLFEGRHRLRIL